MPNHAACKPQKHWAVVVECERMHQITKVCTVAGADVVIMDAVALTAQSSHYSSTDSSTAKQPSTYSNLRAKHITPYLTSHYVQYFVLRFYSHHPCDQKI
ncbi:uncharacterized [Tachysurus ichikawai]